MAFNESAEKAMSVFVALSALGNVLSVIFSQGRIIQELGREGVLPFSSFFASNKPFNSPFPGLFEHYCVSIVILLAPPPGDAYNFISNLITYPLSAINVVVSLGLLWVHFDRWRHARNPNLPPSIFADFNPPIKATIPVTIFFMLASLYLVVAPFLSPDADQSVYKDLPYWLHCVVGIALFAAGAVYWLFWAIIFPKLFNYKLVKQTVIDPTVGQERLSPESRTARLVRAKSSKDLPKPKQNKTKKNSLKKDSPVSICIGVNPTSHCHWSSELRSMNVTPNNLFI